MDVSSFEKKGEKSKLTKMWSTWPSVLKGGYIFDGQS